MAVVRFAVGWAVGNMRFIFLDFYIALALCGCANKCMLNNHSHNSGFHVFDYGQGQEHL